MLLLGIFAVLTIVIFIWTCYSKYTDDPLGGLFMLGVMFGCAAAFLITFAVYLWQTYGPVISVTCNAR